MGAAGILLPALASVLPVAPAGVDAVPAPPAPNNPFAAALVGECVRAKRPARVRAMALDGAQLPRSVAAGHEPGTRPRCARDELRLLRFEALRIDGERTYVRRGGCALPCVLRQATVHVPADAFVRRPDLLPFAARNGNGEAVDGCPQEARAAPQLAGRALERMYYKTPAELRARRNAGRSGGGGARWSNYGDPGATYRSPAGRRTHYTYLLWNLPRSETGVLPGGGIVRAVLRAGHPVVLCDGRRLTLPAFDRRGAPNGYVEFGYARTSTAATAASAALHGWVLLGYRYRERPYVATVQPPATTPPRRPAAPSAGA